MAKKDKVKEDVKNIEVVVEEVKASKVKEAKETKTPSLKIFRRVKAVKNRVIKR